MSLGGRAATQDAQLELAADLRRWLASGELQSDSGAFCAWRDADAGSLAFEYPEITGYALTWLAAQPDPTDQEIAAGRRAADWLTGRLQAGDRSARDGWDDGAAYTFDLGMIAAGLQSFGRDLGDTRHVEQGRSTAEELAAFVRSEAGLESLAPDGPATTRPSEWSTRGGPHLVKCVQSLLLAGEHAAAADLVDAAAAWAQPDGRFQTQPDDDRTMLHPHLYTVEGLWMWGQATGDTEALDRAREATEWVWGHRLDSGGLPRYVDGVAPAPEQWDVTSQAIRAAAMTQADVGGLEIATARLTELARPARDGRALVYQPESGAEHHNAWVSMFGAQALLLAGSGPEAMTWDQLV